MKKLWEAFEGDMSRCQSSAAIVAVEGFNDKTADKIVAGYPRFMEFLAAIEARVTIKPFEKKQVSGSALAGQTVVVTGFRDKALEVFVESQGGKMGTSVSKNTSIVVAKDPGEGSSKLIKAQQLGVRVMSRDEFVSEFGL
jgi:DNA ligase (NAD+)